MVCVLDLENSQKLMKLQIYEWLTILYLSILINFGSADGECFANIKASILFFTIFSTANFTAYSQFPHVLSTKFPHQKIR